MATKGFAKAFAKARLESGTNGVFEYNGKMYNTRSKEEQNFISQNRGSGEMIEVENNLKRKIELRKERKPQSDEVELTVKPVVKKTQAQPIVQKTQAQLVAEQEARSVREAARFNAKMNARDTMRDDVIVKKITTDNQAELMKSKTKGTTELPVGTNPMSDIIRNISLGKKKK